MLLTIILILAAVIFMTDKDAAKLALIPLAILAYRAYFYFDWSHIFNVLGDMALTMIALMLLPLFLLKLFLKGRF